MNRSFPSARYRVKPKSAFLENLIDRLTSQASGFNLADTYDDFLDHRLFGQPCSDALSFLAEGMMHYHQYGELT